MRNYFSIVRSFGLILFGVGVFITGVALPEIINILTYDGLTMQYSIWHEGVALYCIIGIFLIIVGLAGLLKARWFPLGGTIGLIVFTLAGSWFAFVTVRIQDEKGEDLFFALGLLMLFYATMTSFIFLFQNEYFLNALRQDDEGNDQDDRILDAENMLKNK